MLFDHIFSGGLEKRVLFLLSTSFISHLISHTKLDFKLSLKKRICFLTNKKRTSMQKKICYGKSKIRNCDLSSTWEGRCCYFDNHWAPIILLTKIIRITTVLTFSSHHIKNLQIKMRIFALRVLKFK